MATKKDRLKKASDDAFDKFFSGTTESNSEHDNSKADVQSVQKKSSGSEALKTAKNNIKKVFSFRAPEDEVNSWRMYAEAKNIKVDDLGEKALKEYIKRHALSDDEKKVYSMLESLERAKNKA